MKKNDTSLKEEDTMTTTEMLTEIIAEFCDKVDVEKDYDLKELKQILEDIYKEKKGSKSAKSAKSGKPAKPAQGAKQAKPDDTDASSPAKPKKQSKKAKEADDKPKPAKRAPTSYNNFMSERIKALKQENPDTNAKELMTMASHEWKDLSQDQKDAYK